MSDDIIVTFEQDPITIEVTPEGKDGQSLIPCGTWDSTRVYDYLSIVYYDGASYLALQNVPAGTALTDSDYWTVFAAQNSDPSSRASTWGLIQGNIENQLDLQDELDLKADASNVYTKTETDGLLADKADSADVYTKTESDTLLSAKANSADVYTKTQSDNLLGAKANSADVYSKTEADTLLSAKANSDDVYTKTEADNLLSAKANTADLGTMSAENTSNYYTKTATDSLLSAKANTADLGDLATQDSIDYTSNQITNKPTLGSLADQDTVNYETEVTNKPTLGDLASQDSIDYTSAQLTNKPTLGTIAQYDDAPADSKQYVRKNHDWEDLSGTLAEKADKTMLTESVESSMTATQNYTTGALIIVGDQVLRATSNIASGGTLTIGSNVEEVDLETVIAEKADSADLGTLATKDDVASDNKNYVRKNQAWSELVDPVKTASGSIVTVTDALAEPLAGLTVGIEPVQDLHGYSNPWPAGGGKNLLPDYSHLVSGISMPSQTFSDSGTGFGAIIPVEAGATYYLSGGISASNADHTIRFGQFANYPQNGDAPTSYVSIQVARSITIDASANYLVIWFTSPVSGYEVQLELGSSATSYAPYENVCPISGHTGANVTRTGKNLLPSFQSGLWHSVVTGSWTIVYREELATFPTTYTANQYNYTPGIKVVLEPSTQYTISQSPLMYVLIDYYNSNDEKIGNLGQRVTGGSFTTPANTAWAYIAFSNYEGSSVTLTGTEQLQLELGSTASTYEPYTGTSVTIDLDGTRYGGTLDVVNGTLTVTPKYVEYDGSDDESWGFHAVADGNLFRTTASDRKNEYIGSTASGYYCNEFTVAVNQRTNGSFSGSGYNIDFIYDNCSSVAEWRTWLSSNPIQFIYPLATPTTVTLTAQQLALLAGTNNIWTDTGDTSITYWTASAELLLKAIDARIASAN